ncbi:MULTISPECIES: nucleotidyltransferase family protein [unclassified Streptomyces]|uniref:nucleotidyltransferase family protein n=1 Tax=unclassified Streptomyces TaxID=2593676 RepID=UPI003816B33F
MSTTLGAGPTQVNMSDTIWEVLIAVAAARAMPDGRERVMPLLATPGFDFEGLIGNAVRHRLLAALADFLKVHGLRRAVPYRLLGQLDIHCNAGRHRAAILTEEAQRLGGVLRDANVTSAWTKGVVAHHTLHDSSGARLFDDIDLMIHPQHRETVDEVLTASGYSRHSRYDATTHTLVPQSKAALRVYQLSPDHLPHYYRLGPDPVVPYIAVDVANSLTWHTSSWQVPMEEVLTERRSVETGPGKHLYALMPHYAFLFTCLHLFREGWLTRIASRKPLTLSQFGDVVTEWHRLRPADRAEINHTIKRFGLTQPMAWVVAHTDALFGSEITAELDLKFEATPEWLATSMIPDGTSGVFPGTMAQRLRRPLSL